MRRTIRAVITALFATAAAMVVTSAAAAQGAWDAPRGTWTAEAGGGIAVPLGITREVQDLGPLAEAAVGYRVHPRVTLRAEGGLSFLQGAPAPAGGRAMPNMTIYHALGGADVLLLGVSSRASLSASLGAGAAVYDTEGYEGTVENPATGTVEGDFNQTWFTGSGRLKLHYVVGTGARIYVAAGARASLADEEETAVFGVFDRAAGSQGTDVVWTLPLSAGVQVRF